MQLVVIRMYTRGAAQIGDCIDCAKRERIHGGLGTRLPACYVVSAQIIDEMVLEL